MVFPLPRQGFQPLRIARIKLPFSRRINLSGACLLLLQSILSGGCHFLHRGSGKCHPCCLKIKPRGTLLINGRISQFRVPAREDAKVCHLEVKQPEWGYLEDMAIDCEGLPPYVATHPDRLSVPKR